MYATYIRWHLPQTHDCAFATHLSRVLHPNRTLDIGSSISTMRLALLIFATAAAASPFPWAQPAEASASASPAHHHNAHKEPTPTLKLPCACQEAIIPAGQMNAKEVR